MDGRIYQSYYTKSSYITEYMISLLHLSGKEKILEPCAGDGVFIDGIIGHFPDLSIDAYELNPLAYGGLVEKYKENQNIHVKLTDTLLDYDLDMVCKFGGGYDAVIANPPYGAWRDIEDRKYIKKLFNGLYSKESYSLFLMKCIAALKLGGKLSFIIPDTYLYLHRHKDIRKILLETTKIKEISLFPSAFFPGVNFGYANLSIISLEKEANLNVCLSNVVNIKGGYRSVEMLQTRECSFINRVVQSDILTNDDYIFINGVADELVECIKNTRMTIGDVCDCVTGFYSGNDKEYLRVRSKEVKNSKRYQVVDLKKDYIPIVKGGNKKYYKSDDWFMSWSDELVEFYQKSKKARYQNASYYFRNGLAIPMISSSSITASILDNRLFDQSIVGVFPKDDTMMYYLLAFFNSPTCNKLIRTINSSTNNSSNYIKKIPFIYPTNEQQKTVENNIREILSSCKNDDSFDVLLENKNNDIIESIYGF